MVLIKRNALPEPGTTRHRLRVLCSATKAGCIMVCAMLIICIFTVVLPWHCCPNGELESIHLDDSYIPLNKVYSSDGDEADSCPAHVGTDSPCAVGGFNETLHIEPNVDIIFVTDQSSSMRIFNARLEENFHDFIVELTSYTHYWRIIVANSDDGCLSNEGGTFLTPETDNFEQKFV
eukprot:COSAG02_NODE_3856_length_6138_cov_12.727604_4_plen_177_part_00